MSDNGKLTRADRENLLKIARARERVTKSGLSEAGAKLLVDFDKQLDTSYSYNQDKLWKDRKSAQEIHGAAPLSKSRVASARTGGAFLMNVGDPLPLSTASERRSFDQVAVHFDWVPAVQNGRVTFQASIIRREERSRIDFEIDLLALDALSLTRLQLFTKAACRSNHALRNILPTLLVTRSRTATKLRT